VVWVASDLSDTARDSLEGSMLKRHIQKLELKSSNTVVVDSTFPYLLKKKTPQHRFSLKRANNN